MQDPEEIYAESLAHLVWMCDLGQKKYAWYRAQQMSEFDPLLKGIDVSLKNLMLNRRQQKEEE